MAEKMLRGPRSCNWKLSLSNGIFQP